LSTLFFFPPFCCGVHRFRKEEQLTIVKDRYFHSFICQKGNPPKTMKFFMVQALLVAFLFSHTILAEVKRGQVQLGGDGGSSSSSRVSPSHSQICERLMNRR